MIIFQVKVKSNFNNFTFPIITFDKKFNSLFKKLFWFMLEFPNDILSQTFYHTTSGYKNLN